MVEIEVRYLGDLRCESTHLPSGTKLVTDAPVDNHGRGESFSPTDLVATALATCMITTMGIVAQRHNYSLEGARVRVTKEMVSQPARRIGTLTVHLHLPSALAPDARQRLEAAARACPVHKSLHADVETPLMFHYDVA